MGVCRLRMNRHRRGRGGSCCGRCGREVVRMRFEIGASVVVFDTFDFVRRSGSVVGVWPLTGNWKGE